MGHCVVKSSHTDLTGVTLVAFLQELLQGDHFTARGARFGGSAVTLGCPVLEHGAGPGVALQVLDGAAAAAGPGLVLLEQAELPTAVALGPALAAHCTCFGGRQEVFH